MSDPHKWTEREISRMKTLRDEGESFKTIAEILGTVSKGQALRKFREVYGDDGRRANISKTSPRPWTEKDLQTLKDGYAAGDDVEDIIARLDDKRTIDTIYVKASKLGITKPKARKPKVTATNSVTTKAAKPQSIKPKAAPANDSAHPVNIDIEKVGTFLLAGITPFEAAALESVPTDTMRAAYEELGWQEVRIAPNTRISARSMIMEEARQLAGEDIDTANPSHLMIVLSLAADSQKRSFAQVDFSDFPTTELGDVKTAGYGGTYPTGYNYSKIEADNTDTLFHIEEVTVSKLSDRVQKKVSPNIFVGFIDFELHKYRSPRAE